VDNWRGKHLNRLAWLVRPSALALPQIGQSSSILFGEFHHVFRCPVRNITRKIDGINSFYYKDIVQQQNVGFCVASGEDPTDPFADLDPDISCRPKDKIRAGSLKPCKPNCRGVYFSVVAGGAALVAASASTGLSLAPAWAGLLFGTGAALFGGNMVARNMCFGPLYCRTRRNQCCLINIRGSGVSVCPQEC